MSRLTRDGTVEPVSRDQILRRERGQENIHFPCSADHVQDWQPYPVDPYSCYMCDHTSAWLRGGTAINRITYGVTNRLYLSQKLIFQVIRLPKKRSSLGYHLAPKQNHPTKQRAPPSQEQAGAYVGDFCFSWEDVCMSWTRLLLLRLQRI